MYMPTTQSIKPFFFFSKDFKHPINTIQSASGIQNRKFTKFPFTPAYIHQKL